MFKFFKNKSTVQRFPGRVNHSALACTPLLDLYGSLFCLDNFHIIFKDNDNEMKVLAPVALLPRSEGEDYDAYELNDGFAIRHKDNDYFFRAKFEIVDTYRRKMIRLHSINQPILDTSIQGDDIICDTGQNK